MADDVEIGREGPDRLDDLEPVFLALHAHHRAISALPLTEPDERAWAERRATYAARFAEDTAVLLVARRAGTVIGYALALVHAGSDDTFALAPRYGELYTLAVLPTERGVGIGGLLFDAIEQALAERGIAALTVAVMAGNDDALRFYRRRGLAPGEVLLYRLP